MSGFAVRAEGIAKRFLVPHARRTMLRTVQSLLRGEALRRELWVLRGLSFEIATGERVALIGRNGCGKTTLLRLLSGIMEPSAGLLRVGEAPRPLFDTSVGFAQELSVSDNLFLFGAVHGMSRRHLQPRHDEIVRRAGIEHLMHAALKDLSVGQVQRLALTIFAETPARFLIFDEVLGNVDRGFARTAEGFFHGLAERGCTLVMTSHDAAFLRAHCERALWLEDGLIRRDGPFEEVVREYEASFDDASAGARQAGEESPGADDQAPADDAITVPPGRTASGR